MTANPFANDVALGHLASIDASLKRLVELSEKRLARAAASPKAENSEAVAPDSDLDGQHGDEIVKFAPRDWTGRNFVRHRMSECPTPFLEMLAESCEYFARKNDERSEKDSKGSPKSYWDKQTARRARGWAIRNRNKPEQTQAAGDGFDSTPGGW